MLKINVSVIEFIRAITILDEIRWFHTAWENVSPEVVFVIMDL